jgi:hypothetical protein
MYVIITGLIFSPDDLLVLQEDEKTMKFQIGKDAADYAEEHLQQEDYRIVPID